MKTSDEIDPQRLRQLLELEFLEHHAAIGSTQDRAHELAKTISAVDHVQRPLLIVAESQTAGRGRGGNLWWTAPGSLAFSAVLSPATYGLGTLPIPCVSLVAATAIVHVVQQYLPIANCGLHWPNDVFLSGRKLSGILVDVLPHGNYVLGVGINVNNSFTEAPDDVRQRGVSLFDLAAQTFDRTELLSALIRELETCLRNFAEDQANFGQHFNELCLQRGADLTVETSGRLVSGRCTGIAPDGALLLETHGGMQTIYSGVLR
jgi:BirA family biotin operon repressor/biotin-[acetyl-CoA-carboxylase] ligase